MLCDKLHDFVASYYRTFSNERGRMCKAHSLFSQTIQSTVSF